MMGSKFVLGDMNDGNHVSVPMQVDDLEIWYGDRDYIESLCFITPCTDQHFIIGKFSYVYFEFNLLTTCCVNAMCI